MAIEIAMKLEASRKDLLDLGLRNPLLNYRSRTRRLDIVGEMSREVFRILVTDGRSMTFAPVPGDRVNDEAGDLLPVITDSEPDWSALFGENEKVDAEGRAGRHLDTVLQTQLGAKGLHTRLMSIHRDARTILEEQGVNILFLALGFLHWYESQDSAQERIAPLVLVPVELERGSVAEQYKLKYSGEDVGENLSLIEKLKTEFAVALPALTDADPPDLPTYYASVAQAVARQPRWRVAQDEDLLGFFSFGKFLMYKDLAPAAWPKDKVPTDHPILSALLGDGFREPPLTLTDDVNVDALVAPGEMHQVLDADSSQILAILDVNAGRNMVIQGPPGTGKSQTITNVIAESIGKGKKVLFVSEKMAALEVVKRRLDNVGLGDAVLELHSHKTRKRDVLEELRRTLDVGRPKVRDVADDVQSLTVLRDRLNAYCMAVNQPILHSNTRPVDAIGLLLRLGDDARTLPRMDFRVMREWTQATYREQRLRVEELQRRIQALGVAKRSPFWGVHVRVLLPNEEAELRRLVEQAQANAVTIEREGRELAAHLVLPTAIDMGSAVRLCRAAGKALDAPDVTGIGLGEGEWHTRREDVTALTETGLQLADLRRRFAGVLIDEAWSQNLLQERQHLLTYGKKWWRVLSSKYRGARARLAGLMQNAVPKESDKCLEIIDAVLDGQRMQRVYDEFQTLGTKLFGTRWRGRQSDWQEIASLAAWIADVHAEIADGNLPKELLRYLQQSGSKEGLKDRVNNLVGRIRRQMELLRTLETRLELADTTDGKSSEGTLARVRLPDLVEVFRVWLERWDELRLLVSYNAFAAELRELRLETVVELAEGWERSEQDLVRAFDATWYDGLLDAAYRERKPLQQFDRTGHEHAAEKFRELDRLLFKHNRARLALEHWSHLPTLDQGGELSVIHNELNKKKRHLPIRQLVGKAGRALQAIKPVFMMSPLSIANFLPPGAVTFDVVVFDEASQVKPVDALGAVLRAQQVLVVGDSKQLPPSSFFDTLVADDEQVEEPVNVTADLESILSMFLARGAPQRMLRWHYRSRHESLIAVSNHEFYDNKLVVFPSPDFGREGLGLRFQHLERTAYDRGGTRTNPDEAKAVAERVMWYARHHPDLTVGVAAFSVAQRDAIDFQLEFLRRRDTSLEEYFASHEDEPFFVKNLENIQGDERDVILISIGYGKTAEGYLAMNFGPLNQDGGERRLNVLITRARCICEVFCNFTADDLDPGRAPARGVAALKSFLSYARDGRLGVAAATGVAPESPFEEAVLKALQSAGYQVQPQVGAGGFRIDLGVVDDQKPGRFLLGIECDGWKYHSARSARDRDRLREEVLENLGWRIHRIWSTDWFRDPAKELKRVVEAIEKARAYWAGRSGEALLPVGNPARVATVTEIARTKENTRQGEQAVPYRYADIRIRLRDKELHELNVNDLASYVVQVVDAEGPIHVDQVIARITAAAGLKRTGTRIREAINQAIQRACWNKVASRTGDFLCKPGGTVTVRDRTELSQQDKKIELIADEEILAAVQMVVRGAFTITADEAIASACHLLGFSRVSSQIDDVVRMLVHHHAARTGIRVEAGLLSWIGTTS